MTGANVLVSGVSGTKGVSSGRDNNAVRSVKYRTISDVNEPTKEHYTLAGAVIVCTPQINRSVEWTR